MDLHTMIAAFFYMTLVLVMLVVFIAAFVRGAKHDFGVRRMNALLLISAGSVIVLLLPALSARLDRPSDLSPSTGVDLSLILALLPFVVLAFTLYAIVFMRRHKRPTLRDRIDEEFPA